LCSISDELDMAKSPTMTVRLAPEVSEKLEALAHDTKRSKAYLAGEAIASYVELNAWQVAHIKSAFEEDEAGAPGVPHHEVVDWMESWGTDHELPMPVPKKR
jgi:RHH-type rel operon transcriptional repressor/antitoxin RelB